MMSNDVPQSESVSASAPANGGGSRAALASVCKLAAHFSRTPGAGITHFYQPSLPGRWNRRRCRPGRGGLVPDPAWKCGVAGHAAVAGLSLLAAFSPDGDCLYPECRICKSSAFPAELPVVLSDPPGLRIA